MLLHSIIYASFYANYLHWLEGGSLGVFILQVIKWQPRGAQAFPKLQGKLLVKLRQEARLLSPGLTFLSIELCCLIIFYPECLPWKRYLSFPNTERKYSQLSDRVIWYWCKKTLGNFLVTVIFPLPAPQPHTLRFIEQYWAQLNSLSCRKSRLDLFIIQRGNNHKKNHCISFL